MNPNHVFLEAQYPIWAGAGSLFLEFPALSPVSDEDAVFHVFSDVFSNVLQTGKYAAQGLVVETKPREVGNGLPDLSSNTELGGE